MGDPGIGLDNVGHKVLTYKDLVALKPFHDQRAADPADRHPPDRQHGALHVVHGRESS